MRTLNLGILAHVDAGKTTLSERLLYTAGAIDHVGSVDAGTTQTDSLELERERGITIRSAVASFLVGDLAVNLVDTPGHPDFIAEVERVLGVLDGAVLVVSAVEGVQPQTPLLFRALRRLHVPTLIFVNKVDRAGADPERVVEALRRRLSPSVVPMQTVRDPGTRSATVEPISEDDEAHRTALIEVLAEHDEAILSAFVRNEAPMPDSRLRAALADETRRAAVHPVFFGSAAHGVGVHELLAGIVELLRSRAGRPGRASFGPRLQDRADVLGRARGVRPPVRRHAPSAPARAGRWRGARRSRPRSGCSPRPARLAATPSRRGRWRPSEGLVRSGSATRSASRHRARRSPRASRSRRSRRWSSPSNPRSRARSARPSPSSPSRTRSSTSARTRTATRSPCRCTARSRRRSSRRRSSASTASRPTSARRQPSASSDPARVGEAEEVIAAKTKTNITGRSSPLSTNPFKATLGLRIEPAAVGLGDRVPPRRRGSARPALPLQDARGVRDPDGGVRPRGADRGPGGLAGDRLPWSR